MTPIGDGSIDRRKSIARPGPLPAASPHPSSPMTDPASKLLRMAFNCSAFARSGAMPIRLSRKKAVAAPIRTMAHTGRGTHGPASLSSPCSSTEPKMATLQSNPRISGREPEPSSSATTASRKSRSFCRCATLARLVLACPPGVSTAASRVFGSIGPDLAPNVVPTCYRPVAPEAPYSSREMVTFARSPARWPAPSAA